MTVPRGVSHREYLMVAHCATWTRRKHSLALSLARILGVPIALIAPMLNREEYADYIRDTLAYLCAAIRIDSQSNLHDLSIVSETFFCGLLNTAFGWHLENANLAEFNNAGYDLIDKKQRLFVQVTASTDKGKVSKTLRMNAFAQYGGYRIIFLIASDLKLPYCGASFDNPHELVFDSRNDIWNIGDLVKRIRAIPDVDHIQRARDFVGKEIAANELLSFSMGRTCRGTYLSRIAKILIERADAIDEAEDDQGLSFEIEQKIAKNNLVDTREVIARCAPQTLALDNLYDEYDRIGLIKPKKLLTSLGRTYRTMKREHDDNDALFDNMVEFFAQQVEQSPDCPPDALWDEIYWSVEVIMADAFLRCRVFEGVNLKERSSERAEHARS